MLKDQQKLLKKYTSYPKNETGSININAMQLLNHLNLEKNWVKINDDRS